MGRSERSAPRVGVAGALERARWSFWDQEAVLVPVSYHDAICRAGGLTLPLAVDERAAVDPDLLLDHLDAVMLIGGADVDPASYGEPASPAAEASCRPRDAFELALARRAIERELPLLGICRGLQILNVALGGSLIQDLGAERLRRHRPTLGSLTGHRHRVEVEAGTRTASAIGECSHLVRCHHHQAIDRLADGLLVSARAADGVIEGVELPGHPFAVGVQWHPEADEHSRVIASLVDAAVDRVLQVC